jgi:hypothetical protein
MEPTMTPSINRRQALAAGAGLLGKTAMPVRAQAAYPNRGLDLP